MLYIPVFSYTILPRLGHLVSKEGSVAGKIIRQSGSQAREAHCDTGKAGCSSHQI